MKKIENKLQTTRNKVAKHWQHYRTEKKRILSLKRMPMEFKKGLLAEKRDITRTNIKAEFEDYRGFKYSVTHKSDVKFFDFIKDQKGNYRTDPETGKRKYLPFVETEQKLYKAKKTYSRQFLDRDVKKLLEKPKVKGALVIIKTKNEAGQIQYISDFITKNSLERIKANKSTIYGHIGEKSIKAKSTEKIRHKDLYIKVVYEKDKSN